jgi:hypothetical protein
MHRFLIVFTLLLLPFTYVNSLAQTVTIGTEDYLGTEIYGALPINPFFGFTYSQSIYLAEYIDATGTIIAINYHFNGVSLSNSRDLKIYMGHTNKTAFSGRLDWFAGSELTLVFDGTVDSVTGDTWLRIPLTTPFTYNGLDNLVIAVDENAPGYDSPTDKFYFSTVPSNLGNRSLVYTDDTDNPDPEGVLPWGQVFPYYANIQIEGLSMNCKPPRDPSVFDITNTAATASWSTPIGPTTVNYTWKVVTSGAPVESTAVSTGTTTDTTVAIIRFNVWYLL